MTTERKRTKKVPRDENSQIERDREDGRRIIRNELLSKFGNGCVIHEEREPLSSDPDLAGWENAARSVDEAEVRVRIYACGIPHHRAIRAALENARKECSRAGYYWAPPPEIPDGKLEVKQAELFLAELATWVQKRSRGVAIRFGPDGRSCLWGREYFTFSPKQAAVVACLLEAFQNGTPDVAQETLLERAGSAMEGKTARLRELFPEHPAFGTMIVPGKGKGLFRLAEPPR